MKGELTKQILKLVEENPNCNIYGLLEERIGYPRIRAYASIERLIRWGYITRIKKGMFTLTDKGRRRLNRFLYGIMPCPYCGSILVRKFGKRNGTGHQRYFCPSCRFTWTEGRKEEAIMRALRRRKRVVFILHTNERFGIIILQKLREWLKGEELGYLAKHVNLVIP